VEVLLGRGRRRSAPGATTTEFARLSGVQGINRVTVGQGVAAGIKAQDDPEAVRARIAARTGSAYTARQYKREAERFILWAVVERGKAMSDVTAEDSRRYVDFLADIPPRWMSRRQCRVWRPGGRYSGGR